MIQLTRLEEGEIEGDLTVMESQFNPLEPRGEEGSQFSVRSQFIFLAEHVTETTVPHLLSGENGYTSIEATNIKDIEADSQLSSVQSDLEKRDVVNPMYLTVYQEEKIEEVSKGAHRTRLNGRFFDEMISLFFQT